MGKRGRWLVILCHYYDTTFFLLLVGILYRIHFDSHMAELLCLISFGTFFLFLSIFLSFLAFY